MNVTRKRVARTLMVGATLGMTIGVGFSDLTAAAIEHSEHAVAAMVSTTEPLRLGDLGLGSPTTFDGLDLSPGQAACLEVTVDKWGVDQSSIMDDWVAVLYECGLNPGDVVSGAVDDTDVAAQPASEEHLGDGSPAIELVVGTWSLPPITYNIPPDAQTITDQTSSIRVSLPADWSQTDTTIDESSSQPSVAASPDLTGFLEGVEAPGVIYQALPFEEDLIGVLQGSTLGGPSCTDDGVIDYDDGTFAGKAQQFSNCDGSTARVITIAANPPDNHGHYTALLNIKLMGEADDDTTIDTILSSFDRVPVADSTTAPAEPAEPERVPAAPTLVSTEQVVGPVQCDVNCQANPGNPLFRPTQTCKVIGYYSDGSSRTLSSGFC